MPQRLFLWSCDALYLSVINHKPAFNLFFQLFLELAKQFYSCNWVPSRVTEEQLNGLVNMGALAKKEAIHWRVPGPENPPEPKDGEVIVFVDHLGRGFSPPGSKKFRDVLASFQLHPQDIGPNSLSNICNFQVFCEAYLQEEPTVVLFRGFFHLNHRTEFTDGPNTELGGMAIQKKERCQLPSRQASQSPQGLESDLVLLPRYVSNWRKSSVGLLFSPA